MYDICANIKLYKHFQTLATYMKCIEYIQQLVASGDFEFNFKFLPA